MKVTYVGEHDEVEVPDARVLVKQGETVDVPDDIGASLIEQESNWKAAGAKRAAKEGDAE